MMCAKRLLRPRLYHSRKAVSEVVGNILILSITVILFSSLLYWVWCMPTPKEQIFASFIATLDYTGKSGTNYAYTLNLTHRGGVKLEDWRTRILIDNVTAKLGLQRRILHSNPSVGNTWEVGETWRIKLNLPQTTSNPLQDMHAPQNVRLTVIVWDTKMSVAIWSGNVMLSSTHAPMIIDGGSNPSPVQLGKPFRLWARVIDFDSDLDINSIYVNLTSLAPGLGTKQLFYKTGDMFETGWLSPVWLPTLGTYYCSVSAWDMERHNSSATVEVRVWGSELAVMSHDIMVVPTSGANIRIGDWTRLTFTVRNMGFMDCVANVSVYDIPPDNSSRFIGLVNLKLPAGKDSTREFIFNASGPAGSHVVRIEILDALPQDINTTNNVANKPFYVSAGPGQAQWIQTTKSDFDAGTLSNTVSQVGSGDGEVLLLRQPAFTGSVVRDTNYVSKVGLGWELKKTLWFNDPGTYLRIVVVYNLKSIHAGWWIFKAKRAEIRIAIDGTDIAHQVTESQSYQTYRTTVQLYSSYHSPIRHRVDVYLQGDTKNFWLIKPSSTACNDYVEVSVVQSLAGYVQQGTIVSQPKDCGMKVRFDTITWDAGTNANTTITFRTRSAMTLSALASAQWSSVISTPGSHISSPDARYIQFEATLSTIWPDDTPILREVTISWFTPVIDYALGGLNAQYYNNMNLTGPATVTRIDCTVDWQGLGSPAPGISSDYFSVRWTGFLNVELPGNYTFYVEMNDGARLWLDGTNIIDNWTKKVSTLELGGKVFTLSAGLHELRLEYYEHTGTAAYKLKWQYENFPKVVIPSSNLYYYTGVIGYTAGGLRGDYYNGTFTTREFAQIDKTINFDWAFGQPYSHDKKQWLNNDLFSINWSGMLKVDRGEVFILTVYTGDTADGVRLWLDGYLIINCWLSNPVNVEAKATIFLSAGLHRIILSYAETTGPAAIKLFWETFTIAKEIIPSDHLYYR